jgi:hypothetical protein
MYCTSRITLTCSVSRVSHGRRNRDHNASQQASALSVEERKVVTWFDLQWIDGGASIENQEVLDGVGPLILFPRKVHAQGIVKERELRGAA